MDDQLATALEKEYPDLIHSESLDPKAKFRYGMEPGRPCLAIFGMKTGKAIVGKKKIDATLITLPQAKAFLMDLPHYIDEMEGRNG